MKKLFLPLFILFTFFGFVSASPLDDAISWMYDNGLTIYNNSDDFQSNRGLRRDEAAKFFVQFAKSKGKTKYTKTASQCTFTDIDDSRSDLKDIVVESCRMGLFQGSKGRFYPKDQLTNAQAITVLIRILDGRKDEIGASHRSDNYYLKAYELNLLKNVSMETKNTLASRGNVGIIIHNGKNPSTNKIEKSDYYTTCDWYNSEDLPNSNWATAAKLVNSKLQNVRDDGQQMTQNHIRDAYIKLNTPGVSKQDKCMYSRLIDELQNQKGYLTSYKTENGITTIGIDFLSYQDDISKIKWDGPPWLDLMKNTSTKIRYYKLSSNSQLQTLILDNRGYTTYPFTGGIKYINNFDYRLNEHCNNNSIYNGEEDGAGYIGEINRKQANGVDHFCVKDRLKELNLIIFQFNTKGELQKIDLNRWQLAIAG